MKYIWAGILLFAFLLVSVLGYKFFTADFAFQGKAATTIAAPKDEIYRHIAVIDNWLTWSEFNTKNTPDISAVGSGTERKLQWSDPRGGKGELILTNIDAANRKVEFQIITPTFPPMTGSVEVAEPTESKEKSPPNFEVTFQANGELPKSVFYAVASSGYSEMISFQFQKGLNRLKTNLEAAQKKESADPDESAEDEDTKQQ